MKHKSILKSLSLLLILTLLSPLNLWAQKLELISAEGVAAVLSGDKALARDRAIEDALRKAVEQAVGTMIEAETLVSNFQVLNDSIYSKSQGYIQSYAVVKEQVGEDVYRVTVEAIVSMDYLEEDFQAMASLLRRVHKPRLLVKIELEAPGWDKTSNQLNPAESAIIDNFDQKGFDLVGKNAIGSALGQVDSPIFGNDKAAATWGLQQGAEIIIIGRARVKKKHLPILGTMNSYQANISLSAIKTDTAEIMASGSEQAAAVHIDDASGSQQAVEKAARKLGQQLAIRLKNKFSQEISEGTTVQLVIRGVNDHQLVDFKNALGQQVRGIQPGGIHQRFFANGVAKLDVQVKGNAQFLADEITRKNFPNFKISLEGFSANKLELRFIPKGSLPER